MVGLSSNPPLIISKNVNSWFYGLKFGEISFKSDLWLFFRNYWLFLTLLLPDIVIKIWNLNFQTSFNNTLFQKSFWKWIKGELPTFVGCTLPGILPLLQACTFIIKYCFVKQPDNSICLKKCSTMVNWILVELENDIFGFWLLGFSIFFIPMKISLPFIWSIIYFWIHILINQIPALVHSDAFDQF